MTRYKQHPVDEYGWTDWILPARPVYKMSCCDCGLIHDLQFRIANVDDIEFRARRNERATAAKRRSAKVAQAFETASKKLGMFGR